MDNQNANYLTLKMVGK